MDNYIQTVFRQYGNSPTIDADIANFNAWIDPEVDLNNFYDTVFNLQTAVGFGLDIWGRIVGLTSGRLIKIPANALYFGFDESTNGQPFGQQPFYTGKTPTVSYYLSDDAFRKLIFVKALANITNGTVPSLNYLLGYLFAGEGRAYVVDVGKMVIRLVFEFSLSPVELSILVSSGIIPRPAGVLAQVMQVDPSTTFGFNEAGGQPFGSGVFYNQSGIRNAS